MKTRTFYYSFLVLLVCCFNAFLLFEVKNLKVEVQNNFDRTSAEEEELKRGDLIRQVAEGDANAAFHLGRYYGSKGIYEAQLHWLEIAKELGHEGISEEALRGIEQSIIDAHLEP